jgi:serine/threonine protein phosphatase 1
MKDAIIFAIGDVHGKAAHLEAMIKRCDAEAKLDGGRAVFYFLGDIVDRGLQSKQALEIVARVLDSHPGSVLHPGNHDIWFMEAVMSGGRSAQPHLWEEEGGWATMHSFYPELYPERRKMYDILPVIAQNHPDLVRLISRATMLTDHGSMVFCHAGVDRWFPIDDQTLSTVTWIRGPFLNFVDCTVPIVVHGHTVMGARPEVTENRISIDTGACFNGHLTALKVNRAKREIALIQVHGSEGMLEDRYVEPTFLDRGQGTIYDRLDYIFDDWKDAPCAESSLTPA